jgi:hypothetical protein
MRTDLGRPVKLIKSARLPYNVLVVMAEGEMSLPEEGITIREVRLSTFVDDHRAGSIIIDSDITRVPPEASS